MVEPVPERRNFWSRVGRAHWVGLVVAVLATAGTLIAVFADVLPFAAVAAVGFVGIAFLVYLDLHDGDRHEVTPPGTEPQIAQAQVKRNQKHPAHRL